MKLHKPINSPFLLFAIVFLANLFLKLINLGFNSFDYDESISLKNVGLEFGHIKHEAEWDNNPPFYYYCLWVWHHIVEISEFNSRLLSVIFNSLAISLFAVFVSKRVSLFTGVATAILLSFHTMLLYHAQQVRCYSLVLLLVVISSILFFKFLEKPGIVLAIFLGLVNFLIIYTHYIAGIVLIIQGIVLIIHNKRLFWLFSISIILEIGLVLLRFTKKQFLNILGFNKKEDFWLQTPNFADLNSTLNTLSNNTLLKGVFVMAFLALMVLLFVNYSSLINNTLLVYTGLLAIVPVLLVFGLAQFKPIFLTRYFIFSIPFIALLFLLLINYFIESNNYKLLITVVTIIASTYTYKFYLFRDDNYKEAVALVKKVKKQDDLVIINTRDNINLFSYYYNKNLFLNKNLADTLGKLGIIAINDTSELNNTSQNLEKNIILVQQFHNFSGKNNLLEYLSKRKKLAHHLKNYNEIEISFFKK